MANPAFPLLSPQPIWPPLDAVKADPASILKWLHQFQQAYFSLSYDVAGVVNQLTKVGTVADMPPAALQGRLYLATDLTPAVLWEDDGTTWQPLQMAGSITVAAGGVTGVGTLSAAQPDTAYKALVTPVDSTGSPATGSNRVLSVAKATGTLTITVEADPGGTASVIFDYLLVR